MHLQRFSEAQTNRIFAMHFIVFSIERLVEIYSVMNLYFTLSVVFKVSMPVLVSSISPRHDFLPVQVKSFFPLRGRHCSMYKGFIATLDIILRRPIFFFDILQVLMPGVRFELMSALHFRLEAKSFVIIKVRLGDSL